MARGNTGYSASLLAKFNVHQSILAFLIIAISLTYFSGIKGDLPYATNIDEPYYVNPALHIVSMGNLNPHWFGNPGSTIIYPLSGLYHVWYSVQYKLPIWRANPGIVDEYNARPSQFIILGRLLNITYGLLAVGLVYYLGTILFRPEVALLAVLFYGFNILTLLHVHVIRTDIAAVFWSLLSLIFLIRLYDRPSILNQILVGFAIGFSIGTRYFLATLIPLLLLIDLFHVFQQPARLRDRSFWIMTVLGLVSIPVFFFVSSPYFFADFETAQQNILHEARTTHLGADGLSPVGNFLFYINQTLPRSIYLPQEIFALIGCALILVKKQVRNFILPIYSLGFLVGISLQSLHWDRWLIPLFPVFALFSAYAIFETHAWLLEKTKPRLPVFRSLLLALIIVGSAYFPIYKASLLAVKYLNPSSNLMARTWVYDHIPKGSAVVTELYTAPKLHDDYKVHDSGISYTGEGIESYIDQGYQYILVSAGIYDRFYKEPDRYPEAIRYYEDLFNNYPLLYEIGPSPTRHGPVIRIYQIDGG